MCIHTAGVWHTDESVQHFDSGKTLTNFSCAPEDSNLWSWNPGLDLEADALPIEPARPLSNHCRQTQTNSGTSIRHSVLPENLERHCRLRMASRQSGFRDQASRSFTFRSSETQATYDVCFSHQSICSFVSFDSGIKTASRRVS